MTIWGARQFLAGRQALPRFPSILAQVYNLVAHPVGVEMSPTVSTHADARGVHDGQEHLLATRMILRTCVTEPALLIRDTLNADPGCWFATSPTRDRRRGIAGEHLDGWAFRFPVFFGEHFQAHFRGGAKVILVEKGESWTEHVVQPHPHVFLAHLPLRNHAST